MAQAQTPPPTRLQHPDPTTNAIFQDIYNKLNQLQQTIEAIKKLLP